MRVSQARLRQIAKNESMRSSLFALREAEGDVELWLKALKIARLDKGYRTVLHRHVVMARDGCVHTYVLADEKASHTRKQGKASRAKESKKAAAQEEPSDDEESDESAEDEDDEEHFQTVAPRRYMRTSPLPKRRSAPLSTVDGEPVAPATTSRYRLRPRPEQQTGKGRRYSGRFAF